MVVDESFANRLEDEERGLNERKERLYRIFTHEIVPPSHRTHSNTIPPSKTIPLRNASETVNQPQHLPDDESDAWAREAQPSSKHPSRNRFTIAELPTDELAPPRTYPNAFRRETFPQRDIQAQQQSRKTARPYRDISLEGQSIPKPDSQQGQSERAPTRRADKIDARRGQNDVASRRWRERGLAESNGEALAARKSSRTLPQLEGLSMEKRDEHLEPPKSSPLGASRLPWSTNQPETAPEMYRHRKLTQPQPAELEATRRRARSRSYSPQRRTDWERRHSEREPPLAELPEQKVPATELPAREIPLRSSRVRKFSNREPTIAVELEAEIPRKEAQPGLQINQLNSTEASSWLN